MLTERHTGVAVYVLELIRALLKALPDHYELIIFAKTGSTPAIRKLMKGRGDFQVVEVPGKRFWTSWHLAWFLRRMPQAERPASMLFPAHAVPPFCPVPAVVTVHDLAFLLFPKHFTAADRFRLRLITKTGLNRARRVLAVSHATKQDLHRYYGLPEAKVNVTPLACDRSFFKPAAAAEVARVKKVYSLTKPYILAVGTVQRRKNYDRLIAAVALLRERGRDIDLVIVGGKGWLAQDTERAAAGAQDSFLHLLGYVPREDLPPLYTGAAVSAQVSLYEGFGIPVLEAYACGTHMVVSDRSALPEVAGGGAVQVDPYSIESIAAGLTEALEPKKAAALRARSAEELKRFSWEETAEATLEVLTEVAEEML